MRTRNLALLMMVSCCLSKKGTVKSQCINQS
jgi:hypothetical protein